MNIQVLVATMHQKKNDYALIERMNIQTSAIVCNQCDRNDFTDFEWKGNKIRWLSFAERGVGLNRNNALMRATGDICLFADDDMQYIDDYTLIVEEAFRNIPQADVIIFNVNGRKKNTKRIRINWLNYLRYGTVRIAIRTKSIREKGIYFNQCFGGGTEHRHGEDNLFLTSCLRMGLKIYAEPALIASLTEERQSSWNRGFDEKYFWDQGALYRLISKRWWILLCLQDSIKRQKAYKICWIVSFSIMLRGAKNV